MSPTARYRAEPGTALAGVLIVLALLGASVLIVVAAWGDQSAMDGQRGCALRLRYAAESGAMVVARQAGLAETVPTGQVGVGEAWFEVTDTAIAGDQCLVTVDSGSGFLNRTDQIDVRPQ